MSDAQTYDVCHETKFQYDDDVRMSQQILHLTPRSFDGQQVDSVQIDVDPLPAARETRTDYFGNEATYIALAEPHQALSIASVSRVTVQRPDVGPLDRSERWEQIRTATAEPVSPTGIDAALYCHESPYIEIPEQISELTADIFLPGRPVLDAVMALTSRIHHDFTYKGGVTDIYTPVADVLKLRQGVCQDFAHLQLACLRALGLAARYVSGYLLTVPPEGKERLIGADESHAWLSVWSHSNGWVDFDPTNNKIPGNDYVVLGWGRDYADVTPVNGFIVGGGSHELKVSVDMRPVAA